MGFGPDAADPHPRRLPCRPWAQADPRCWRAWDGGLLLGRSRDRVVGGLNPWSLRWGRPAVDSRFSALGTCTWGFRSPSRLSVLLPAGGEGSLMPGSQPDSAVGFPNMRVSHWGSGSRQVRELCVCISPLPAPRHPAPQCFRSGCSPFCPASPLGQDLPPECGFKG